MKYRAEILEPPRPWHVLLSVLVPLLALVRGNVASAGADAALWSLGVSLCGVMLLWVALARISGDVRRSALATSALALTGLSAVTIERAAAYAHVPHGRPLLLVLVVAFCAGILRFGGRAAVPTTFANVLLLSATCLLGWPIARSELASARATPVKNASILAAAPVDGRNPRPDVYIIILDAYGRADTMREQFAFQNDLPDQLRSLGFFVADQAASNYQRTAESLASSLNLDYLQSMIGDMHPDARFRHDLAALIAENRVFEAFRDSGYRIRAYTSEYRAVQPGPANERPHPWFYLTDFEYGFYEATMLPRIMAAAGAPRGWAPLKVHRRQIRWTLTELTAGGPTAGSPPMLVFAHLLLPHPPFVFKADGTDRPSRLPATFADDVSWHRLASGTDESYRDGYVDGVRFVNARVVEIVRSVLARTDRPAIIYIQGDHGPRFRPRAGEPDRSSLRERMGILLAVRFPVPVYVPLHARVTPVNAWRVVVSRALSSSVTLLEDRSVLRKLWRRTSPVPGRLGACELTLLVRHPKIRCARLNLRRRTAPRRAVREGP